MSSRTLAWGVKGGGSLLLALACGGQKIHDVGDVDGGGSAGRGSASAGSSGTLDAGGTSAGSSSDICQHAGGSLVTDIDGKQYNCGGGPNSAGYGGSDVVGTGGSAPTCFSGFNASPGNNESSLPPRLGPQNAVFVDAHVAVASGVKNYADQLVFGDSDSVWEAYANFATNPLAADTTLSLPADIARVSANLGQFYLTRQNCAGLPAAGHKLSVEVWWKLGGAIIGFPTEGLALGTVSKNEPVWFDDTVHAFVKGDPEAQRVMNTLNKIVIEHTFAADDKTDAGKITLGLWLVPDFDFPSTFYIGNVAWD